MKRGFTLVEVLVVIGIVAVVSAIVTPIFQRAKESARITSAVSYMHQIGRAVSIYRADWESGGGYSSTHELGLPTQEYVFSTHMGLSSQPPTSPCGYRPGIGWDSSNHLAKYKWLYFWTEVSPQKLANLEKYKENTVLVMDPWCNPSGTEWSNPYVEKRAIGLLLSGQVVNRKKPGIADHQDWWAAEPP